MIILVQKKIYFLIYKGIDNLYIDFDGLRIYIFKWQ